MDNFSAYLNGVSQVLQQVPAGPIAETAGLLKQARDRGQQIFMFGNGGSAANASHIVTDMVKGIIQPGKPRMKVMCLADNIPMLTAYANDYSYAEVFSGPLAAYGSRGDIAFGISGSGNSPNVLKAMQQAGEMGMQRIGLSGMGGGKLKDLVEVCMVVPSDSMQMIEDAHLVILHAIFLDLM